MTVFCECGCGLPAPIAQKTITRLGHVKGEPIRFISGHNLKAFRREEAHAQWQGDTVSEWGGRDRARRKYALAGSCQHPGCEKPAVDRHHRDGNVRNNDASNIAFLCRRHHMAIDGRLHNNPMAKLTRADVEAIRTSDKTHLDLAAEYGVSRTTIQNVIYRRRYVETA